ncbi:MAG: ChaN family lipoprotein [Bacteroidia bacterium]
MKVRLFFLFLSFLLINSAFAPSGDPATHQWFSSKGKKMDWDKVVKEMLEADIVFFGEQHNDMIAHWYELKLAEAAFEAKGANFLMGCEMFESDNQLVLNEYLEGLLNEKKLKENARLWDNHATDYAPLLQFAKKNHLRLIATNTPRRYASLVFSGGFEALDSLSPEAKSYLPSLPILYDTTVKCYNDLLHGPMMGHSSENLPKAQALKDATMAYFILKNREPGKFFYHWNGSYHSDNHEGIVWYLKQARPDLKIYVISTVSQKELGELEEEYKGKADAILVTDETFPTSY